MEQQPVYSEWKETHEIYYCPYCERNTANMMARFVTNRDGEKERQFRVECPVCDHAGKTYLHKSIAAQSWEVRENDPPKEVFPYRRTSK